MRQLYFTQALLGLIIIVWLGTSYAAAGPNDEVIPYLDDHYFPARTAPIYEHGDPHLGPGPITPAKTLDSGAVINKSFWVFGSYRTAWQWFRTGDDTVLEWPMRLDLFGNWQFSGTERLLIGVQPLVHNASFTRYVFNPNRRKGFKNNFNLNITTLFFEADIGEMLPKWLQSLSNGGDIGIAVGRQNLFFQEGILLNDSMDAVGITQNSILGDHFLNTQWSVYAAVNDINRSNGVEDKDALLWGFHLASDTAKRTLMFDLAYVKSDDEYKLNDDLVNLGIASIQRQGRWGTSYRFLASHALDNSTAVADDGAMAFIESNWVPCTSDDIYYGNFALVFGQFTSVARDPLAGGPLGRLGILFAANGLGELAAPINNSANEVAAFAVGIEHFIDPQRQTIVELGGRKSLTATGDALGLSLRFQQGIARRVVLQADLFYVLREDLEPALGSRFEAQIKF